MSMCMYLRRSSELELARFARDGFDPHELIAGASAMGGLPQPVPAEVERWLTGPASTQVLERLPASWQAGVRQQMQDHLAKLRRAEAGRQPGQGRPAPEPVLDLHKSWHTLHFVFTGDAWAGPMPAATLLAGGSEIGDDLGYGPARVIGEQATGAFARFLAPLDAPTLAARLDLSRMRQLGIYCAGGSDPGTLMELQEDIEHYFAELKAYVAEAAQRRMGLLVWLD